MDSQAVLDERISRRTPPQDLPAEQAVLGSALISEEALIYACGHLNAEDFYDRRHRLIFELMKDLFAANRTVDFILLCGELDTRGLVEAAGGYVYIESLTANLIVSNYRLYCEAILNKSMLRRLIAALDQVLQHCYGDSANIDEVIDLAARDLYNIRENRDDRGFVQLKEVLQEQLAAWREARIQGKSQTIPSGYPCLDRALGGLHKGALIILAARPGMGKTALALNMAHKAAWLHQIPVAVFSLEMSRYEVGNRFLSLQSSIDLHKLGADRLSDEVIASAERGISEIVQAPIFINDITGVTPVDMLSRCRQLQLLHRQKTGQDLGLVIVDYLQLMSSGRKNGGDNRQQEISDISRNLKIMARELNVPVIALSQLSRAAEQRTNKRPMLSDLRDSGAIEQDADVVLFLYRDQYYAQEGEKEVQEVEEAELIVAKNRHGATNTLHLGWIPRYTQFFEAQPEHTVGEAPPYTGDVMDPPF